MRLQKPMKQIKHKKNTIIIELDDFTINRLLNILITNNLIKRWNKITDKFYFITFK